MAQQREIQYSNKTFADFRQQLIDYTKNYFPDTYNDFSPTSPGMMFMEMAAYVGDVLSFYQDIQLQETFLQYAQEPGNLYSLAYMMGYRPKLSTAASVILDVYQEVPAILSGTEYVPNYDYAITVDNNAVVQSNTGTPVKFLIQDKIDFSFSSSYDPTEVTVLTTSLGNPNTFLLKKQTSAISAEIKTVDISIDTFERFRTLTIADTDILGVLDIVDSNNNSWTEVPYLAQDTVFQEVVNTGPDRDDAPYLLQLQKTPRRFVTRFTTTGVLQIQFGAGQDGQNDEIITPDPTNVGLGDQTIGVSKIDKAYDPSNFMFTGAYGVSPVNTVLTIRYLIGGGVAANTPANTITTVVSATKTPRVVSATGFENTFRVDNTSPASGGKDGDTVEELRQNSLRAFNEQLRTVTREDYTVRALAMPTKFGSVAKVFVTQDQLRSVKSSTDNIVDSNPLSLSMFILAYDNQGKLSTATPVLKENLRTYLSQYRMLTDAVNIKDAFIVNIGIKYEIILRPSATGRDVLMKCTEALQDYFEISKWSINQPINVSKLYTILDKVKGVQTVKNIEITNKVGAGYTSYGYDIKSATRNNVVYPSYDPCIFELKYPNVDIEGRITSL
jgi:hypothetical protein